MVEIKRIWGWKHKNRFRDFTIQLLINKTVLVLTKKKKNSTILSEKNDVIAWTSHPLLPLLKHSY